MTRGLWWQLQSGDELAVQRIDEQIRAIDERPLEAPRIRDKWLLSSALQKLIRRGQVDAAVAVALSLHQVDRGYLRRRLPVVAAEDVGVGSLTVCRVVVVVCSDARWWRDDVGRTIAYVVSLLAGAIKSRAACDAFCLAEAQAQSWASRAMRLGAGVERWVEVASDVSRLRLERIDALRVLGGVTERDRGRYMTVSRCDSAALDRVAERLALPTAVRWLMARNGKCGQLTAMLPIAVEAVGEPTVEANDAFPRALERVGGIPLCALDMYSEAGRGAIRELVLASAALRGFAREFIRGSSPVRVVSMALFQLESCTLDRYLSSDRLDSLTEETERAELGQLGLADPGGRGVLRDILRAEADRLAEIRTRRLMALPGAAADTGRVWGEAEHG